MNISKYAAFFHDGSIFDIAHRGGTISFYLASAEMDEEDAKDGIILSKDNSIQGILHIGGVRSIVINKMPFSGIMKKKHDNGIIFDLEIMEHAIELSIDWVNFPPKPEVNEFSVIKIEAEKIWWENLPNLSV